MIVEKHEMSVDSELSLKKEKYFLKEEIIKKIESIAQADGIESGDLQSKPEKEVYDSEGNLLYLSIQVTQECALGKNEGSISYIYLVKGKHETGEMPVTTIVKAYGSIEKPDEVYFSSAVSEYVEAEDKWIKP